MKEPIRILHVVTTMNLGGLENYLMNLYRNIDRTKIQFDFLMHRIEESAFDREIEALGGKIYRLNPIRPMLYFQYQAELKFFLKKHPEYIIVHSHINANSALVLSAAKKVGIPVRIAHAHIAATAKKNWIFREILKMRVHGLATHHLACSKEAGKWLYGTNDFKVFNNGIDAQKYKFNNEMRLAIRAALNVESNEILIGHVGRFNTQKNHEFLINVFVKYNNEQPSSKLILIGEGELKENIKNQIDKLGLNDKVILTGAINNPNDYLNAMDLYLFPSLFEGLPLALVEAQCNGLPTLMSDTVSKDTKLTNLMVIKSLKNKDQEWANDLIEIQNRFKNHDRSVYSEVINKKGFDVVKNVFEIEEFYLELFKAYTTK